MPLNLSTFYSLRPEWKPVHSQASRDALGPTLAPSPWLLSPQLHWVLLTCFLNYHWGNGAPAISQPSPGWPGIELHDCTLPTFIFIRLQEAKPACKQSLYLSKDTRVLKKKKDLEQVTLKVVQFIPRQTSLGRRVINTGTVLPITSQRVIKLLSNYQFTPAVA